MKLMPWTGLLLIGALSLTGCSEESIKPQDPAIETAEANTQQDTQVPQHNLSRIAKAKPASPAQLEALKVGQTSKAEVMSLLGEVEPFTLGGGKQILRYDVGKFIFDGNGILIRKFLNTPK